MVQVSSRPVDFFAHQMIASLLAVTSAASLAACKPESEASAATESAHGPAAEPLAAATSAASTPAPGAGGYLLELAGTNAGSVLTPTGGNRRGVVAKSNQNKFIGSVTYEPIALQAPVALDAHLLDWIGDTLSGASDSERDGEVNSYDFNFHRLESLQFSNADLTEVRFPAMVAAGHLTDTITVKLAPEQTRRRPDSGTVSAPGNAQGWLQNNYQVDIAGLDGNRVQRVEPFTVKFSTGPHGAPVVDIGNLVLTLPRTYASDWIDWADDFLAHAGQGDAGEREGQLVYLDAGLHAMLTVNLHHVGIVRVSDATNDPTHVVVELYVETVDITRP